MARRNDATDIVLDILKIIIIAIIGYIIIKVFFGIA